MGAIKKISQLGPQWETADPFLFCAFHNDKYPKGNGSLGPDAPLAGRLIGQDFQQQDGWAMYHGRKVPGFPAHPHMGFETVTLAETGYVDHSDSLGAAGRFGNGDVQWMTAGKGVQHSEMFPLVKTDEENPLLLFQIWLNLPAKSKKVEPHFSMFWSGKIPTVKKQDAAGKSMKIKLIAGDYGDVKAPTPPPDSWAADPKNEVAIWLIDLEAGAQFSLDALTGNTNRSLYFFEGDTITTEGFEVPPLHRLILDAGESFTLINGASPARFLLLQGNPINESVVKHGPFVANSRADIEEGFLRFRENEFGGWPWPTHEHTHEAGSGRFAKFPDGRMEYPSQD
ncbi:MAG: pirin [Cytophagaceae bacterium]|nr:pirin [Cytophagaceae bacterium]|tara:strand:+ start:980 stop:1999 length:1020 start_codon:yes stop_codon:yes gene_type:complete